LDFETLGLAKPFLKVLERQGLFKPTPIQEQSIPIILKGKDLIGLAQTGTGKTVAFTVPVLNVLYAFERRGKFRPVRMLVLSPTRELAVQVESVIKEFASAANLRSLAIFGGVPFFRQAQALRKGVDILVCTPGRLEDHISQKTVDLSRVNHLVLDEADQMLDIGFLPAIKRLFSLLPIEKQTLLFSATMSKEIKNLTLDYLRKPSHVSIASKVKSPDKIIQQIIFLSTSEKLDTLKNLISSRPKKRILVFLKTKHGADKIVKCLIKVGLVVDAIHGNKSQAQRQRTLENFKKGKCFVLIATDIAARGIDVQNVELVVNYDLPDVPETYVHRIGRTARAGASGQSISFCSGREKKQLDAIERLIKIKIKNVSSDFKEVSRPTVTSEFDPAKVRQKSKRKRKASTGNSRAWDKGLSLKKEIGNRSKFSRRKKKN